jgi:ligand-binding sensor domain-containing protein
LAGDRWERAWPVDQEGPSRASAIVAVSAEEMWAGDWGGTGVWHYTHGRWTNSSPGLPADAIVFDLASAPDGRLWAATEKGVAVQAAGRWTLVDKRWSRGLAFAADGTVWVGGQGAGGGIRTIRSAADGWAVASVTTAGLPRDGVSELAIGRDGSVWAVDFDSSSQGLARFDGTEWTVASPVPEGSGFGADQVLAAAQDGGIWALLGADAPGVARLDRAAWTLYRAADGLPGDPSWLEIGPDGQPWVSGPGGFARFDGERWVEVRAAPVQPGADRFAVAPDGTIWVAGPSMVAGS